MSHLQVVNIVETNLISNLISLAAGNLIFAFQNTSHNSPFTPGAVTADVLIVGSGGKSHFRFLTPSRSVSQLTDLYFPLAFDPLTGKDDPQN